MVLTTKLKFLKVQMTEVSITMLLTQHFKGAVSRNSAKLGNYKMPVKLLLATSKIMLRRHICLSRISDFVIYM